MVRTGKKGVDGGDYDAKVNDALAELHRKVHASHSKKLKVDDGLGAIEVVYDKMRTDKRMTSQHKTKLRGLYATSLKDCQTEADALRKCLADIAYIRRLRLEKRVQARRTAALAALQAHGSGKGSTTAAPTMRRGALMVLLQQAANTLPLFIGKLNESPPALCGAIPEDSGHICQPGDAVAALVKADQHEADENWILADVVSFNTQTNKYEVEDVDEEQKLRYQLPKRKMIGLAQWRANPDTDGDALFPQDAVVLALYPQTTCFYKGVIEQTPVLPTDDYLVAFEDSSYPSNYSPPLPVPQRYVVAYRDVKK